MSIYLAGHVDKVLITTTLGSRGLEKKIVVYISGENTGDFLAIVKVRHEDLGSEDRKSVVRERV